MKGKSLFVLICILAIFVGCKPTGSKSHKIAVFKIVSHPAIDKMETAFKEYLSRDDQHKFNFDTYNCQGMSTRVAEDAQQIKDGGYELVFVLGTPCAIALKNLKATMPIVVGGATDPVGTGLVATVAKPGGNITGTTDLPPFKEHLAILKSLMPSAKRIGVLYNETELNSRLALKHLSEVATPDIQIIRLPVSSPSQIPGAITDNKARFDVLCLPTDNLVQANLSQVLTITNDHTIPAFNCDLDSVKKGALFSVAVDYGDIGVLSAKIATRILFKGENPSSIPIQQLENPIVYVNKKSMKKFNLILPDNLKSNVQIIE